MRYVALQHEKIEIGPLSEKLINKNHGGLIFLLVQFENGLVISKQKKFVTHPTKKWRSKN